MSIGDWTEQQLLEFVGQHLGVPKNLSGLLSLGAPAAPVMQNGWTNYNGSVLCWLDGAGYGHVVGEVQDGGGATVAVGTVLFTLPFGLRYRRYFPITDNDGSIRNVMVQPDGDVAISDNGPAFRAGSAPSLGHLYFPTF